ncbi:non-specific serine/threonine protein kinase [Salvia divinorum]|uniref:Non-specific serine/threonine protein kinase n=1 Tax=Salvia divinorum TaxID=28513 RepID=A0ABD1FML9_SALDI
MITTHNFFIFLITSSFLILSLHFFHCADAKKCSPSACGDIRNISSPFRLKGDPSHCGDPKFELTCENNATFVYLDSFKYYVKGINYVSSTIRLVEASLNNDDICSFPVRSSYPYPYYTVGEWLVNLISCPNPVNNSSTLFIDITACNLSHPRFSYVNVGSIMPSEVPHMCTLDLIVMISGWGVKNVSLSEIHQSLLRGFDLYFCYNCNEKSTIWDKLRYLLSGPNRYLLIPLAFLGVSLPVIIIIGIAGVLALSFTNFLAYVLYGYYLHLLEVSTNGNAFIAMFAVICVAIAVCLTAALNPLLIIIIAAWSWIATLL